MTKWLIMLGMPATVLVYILAQEFPEIRGFIYASFPLAIVFFRAILRQKFHSSVENDIEELRTEKNSKMLQDRWALSLELHESSNKDREK